MLNFLITFIKIVFILGFLVFIHEGGHFLIAKLCKIKVNEFAIGFGPIVWRKQGKETKYALRLIPLGGFVSMEGEDQQSDAEGSFSKASIPKRIAVTLAGGLVNIIFALIVYFVLLSFTGNNVSTTINSVMDGTNAQIAGIQAGDEIVKINGENINYKSDLDNAMDKYDGNGMEVVVKRNDEKLTFNIKPEEEKYNYTGIAITNGETDTTKIAAIYPESPAAVQGLETNDVIVLVNSVDVKDNSQKLVEEINKNIGEKITFTVERNNEDIQIEIVPEVRTNYYIGVYLKMAENNFSNNIYYAFLETGEFAFSIVDNLKLLFTGHVSIDQMMGPVGIGGIVAQTSGVEDFIYILVLISISLGFTNLLPFPPLDGGKVVILLIEWIRKKPLQEKTEITIQMIGSLVLIGLAFLVTYNDILRIF